MATHTDTTDPFPATISTIESEPDHHYDDLDDVFGSEPSSPSREVFFDGDGEGEAGYGRGGNREVSDIPRLKEKHETEGYRDGVTQGKAKTVQQGFDEGYQLGAVVGLRIGKIRGVLEGVGAAIGRAAGERGMGGENMEWEAERVRVEGLLMRAWEELRTESVFGREWWGTDGIWRFEVPGDGEGMGVVFTDVASAHPLVKKWEAVVEEEVKRWGLDMSIMENKLEIEATEAKVAVEKQEMPVRVALGATKELVW